jgi:hypothetical protein
MISGVYPLIGAETEYFWYQDRRNWVLQTIEDPRDPDPVRYAILACLVEELVKAFNWRLSLGMRRNRQHLHRAADDDPYPSFTPEILPPWTKDVPPIDPAQTVDLPSTMVDPQGKLILEDGGTSQVFAKRNIITDIGWLYTI